MAVIKGSQLMLFLNGFSIAKATNHTLTLNNELASTRTKDDGLAVKNEVTGTSWEISTDNLFTKNEFSNLFNLHKNGTEVTVGFGIPAGYNCGGSYTGNAWQASGLPKDDEGPTYGWSAPAAAFSAYSFYYGQAIISNLQVNAPVEGDATMSATFTGNGSLKFSYNG